MLYGKKGADGCCINIHQQKNNIKDKTSESDRYPFSMLVRLPSQNYHLFIAIFMHCLFGSYDNQIDSREAPLNVAILANIHNHFVMEGKQPHTPFIFPTIQVLSEHATMSSDQQCKYLLTLKENVNTMSQVDHLQLTMIFLDECKFKSVLNKLILMKARELSTNKMQIEYQKLIAEISLKENAFETEKVEQELKSAFSSQMASYAWKGCSLVMSLAATLLGIKLATASEGWIQTGLSLGVSVFGSVASLLVVSDI